MTNIWFTFVFLSFYIVLPLFLSLDPRPLKIVDARLNPEHPSLKRNTQSFCLIYDSLKSLRGCGFESYFNQFSKNLPVPRKEFAESQTTSKRRLALIHIWELKNPRSWIKIIPSRIWNSNLPETWTSELTLSTIIKAFLEALDLIFREDSKSM